MKTTAEEMNMTRFSQVSRNPRRAGQIIGFCLAAAPVVSLLLPLVPAPVFADAKEIKRAGEPIDLSYNVTTDPTPVHLQIGDRTFTIPKNYIWSREDWKDGKVTGVNLHALLPSFEPVTKAGIDIVSVSILRTTDSLRSIG